MWRRLVNNVDPASVNLQLSLIRAAAAGDRDARRRLFENYRDAAYRVAFRITGRMEDALDVVQDSFIAAFDKLDQFQGEGGFTTWLLRIVTNRALDHLRARKVRQTVPLVRDNEDAPEPIITYKDAAAADDGLARLTREEVGSRLRQALEALPPDQRAVFALYANGDMTYGEIAAVLGIPIGTVMSRLFHARRKLRDELSDLAPESWAQDDNNAPD